MRVRSVLFLPASNPRAVEKARTLPADVVVLDLEDAVGPEHKVEARRAAVEALAVGGFSGAVAVRINALDTPWGEADLAALTDATLLILPKVESVDDLVRASLRGAGELWAMIETPRGLVNMDAIAAAGHGLSGLMLGVNDLGAAMRFGPSPDREPFKPVMCRLIAAARANGVLAIDGVYNRLDDIEGFVAECAQGRLYGFDGKSLIHPKQIDPANAAFAPSAGEIAWATRIVAAFDAQDARQLGVISVGGAMVERLHLDQAQAILASVEAAGTVRA